VRQILFFFLILALPTAAFAQEAERTEPLNARDAAGKPHGLWYIRQPARMGEPASTQWGMFEHGAKTGVWYTTDAEGELISTERFRAGLKHGEARYFERGRVLAAGPYLALNATRAWDTVWVTDAVTLAERRVPIRTERGSIRHGLWRFYDAESGRLVREVDYQADEAVYERTFLISAQDSSYYRQRAARLPHVRNPRAARASSYSTKLGY